MAKETRTRDLIRLVKARQRLRERNAERPVHMRRTAEDIDRITRLALKDGRINDYGIILKKED